MTEFGATVRRRRRRRRHKHRGLAHLHDRATEFCATVHYRRHKHRAIARLQFKQQAHLYASMHGNMPAPAHLLLYLINWIIHRGQGRQELIRAILVDAGIGVLARARRLLPNRANR